MPLSVSPNTHNQSPSSPESDLDVDSAPDEIVPENLSLKKKERSKSPAGNNNYSNNNLGFLPYQQQSFHQGNVMSTSPNQRSPVDVLLRYYLMFFKTNIEFFKLIISTEYFQIEDEVRLSNSWHAIEAMLCKLWKRCFVVTIH